MHRVNPVVLVLISIASVQLGAAFGKGLFDVAAPATIAFLRIALASVVLVAISRPRLTGRSARDWAIVVAYGLALSGMNISIYYSFERIPIGVAVTLEFIGPLLLAVWGSRRPIDLLWVVLAGVGVALLGASPGSLDLVGVVLALLAGALWAAYIVIAGPVGRRWEGISGLSVGSTIGALALAIPGLMLAGDALGHPRVWLVATAVALLSSVVPYALELHARRVIKAATFSVLMSLEPAAAALFAWVVLGEWLGWVEWLAMAAVVVASVGAVRTARRRVESAHE
ncbi:EamA family transporter [Tessaracoccus sp.]|uniref:EamA family transporter n=1 Tax=Tessaracoccus sp. TaxID=1971211 RepID=UPI002636C3F5|nr:EamA family transporter [Tessaracoccus sp.]